SFGRPMDVLGNFVDEAGRSLSQRGNLVDVKSYFMSRGEVTRDPQRDQEYTRYLGERIAERYHIENHVYSSHLVAFAAFEYLRKKHPELDLYGLLRLPEDDRRITKEAFHQLVSRLFNRLRELSDHGRVHLAQHMINDVATIIEHGVRNLGIYHAKRPLRFATEHELGIESMNLLYYYHNRLVGYGLESLI
ncbi:MAG: glycerol-3-phosphate acyltransferase, partial [Bacteroidota bacterium]